MSYAFPGYFLTIDKTLNNSRPIMKKTYDISPDLEWKFHGDGRIIHKKSNLCIEYKLNSMINPLINLCTSTGFDSSRRWRVHKPAWTFSPIIYPILRTQNKIFFGDETKPYYQLSLNYPYTTSNKLFIDKHFLIDNTVYPTPNHYYQIKKLEYLPSQIYNQLHNAMKNIISPSDCAIYYNKMTERYNLNNNKSYNKWLNKNKMKIINNIVQERLKNKKFKKLLKSTKKQNLIFDDLYSTTLGVGGMNETNNNNLYGKLLSNISTKI